MALLIKLETYYASLGTYTWWLYLCAAIGLFVSTVVWAFDCAKSVTTIAEADANSKELFHALAYLTIGTAVVTFLDFLLHDKDKRAGVRLTPIQIASGTLATLLGIVLYTLDSDKKGKTMQLVLFQTCANVSCRFLSFCVPSASTPPFQLLTLRLCTPLHCSAAGDPTGGHI